MYTLPLTTIKWHKCEDHNPEVEHECGITARKKVADFCTDLTWLAGGVSAILSAICEAALEHCTLLQQRFRDEYGLDLRYNFWIDSWLVVPLHLPSVVDEAWRLMCCDIKQCFDNVPIKGEEGLETIIPEVMHEGFTFKSGKLLWVPFDSQGMPLKKAKFSRSTPWAGEHSNVDSYKHISSDLAV